jgi:hypothetical protein
MRIPLVIIAQLISPPAAAAPVVSSSDVGLADPVRGAAMPADSAGSHDLGPTTAVPWNPPRALRGEEPWETAVRLPGRLVSLPLALLGSAGRAGTLAIEQHHVVPRVMMLAHLFPDVGIVLAPADLGDHTGFGLTLGFAPKPLRRHLRAEVSGSTRQYNSTWLGLGAGPLAVGYGEEWRSQDHFSGLGMDAHLEEEAVYALHTRRAAARLEWPPPSPEGPSARARLAAHAGLREAATRRGRPDDDDPLLATAFPSLAAALDDRRVEHLVWGGRAALDRRAGAPHWSRGWRLEGAFERFDAPPGGLSLGPDNPAGARFTRTTVEAEAGVSFGRDPRTFRLLVQVTDQRVSPGDGAFLLADLMTLGGGRGLWGFEPRRFHELDLALARLTYVYPLAQHFEFELHAETGGVYRALSEDLAPRALETSFGLSLRPRTKAAPLGMVGVDMSREGARVRFTVGGVE